MPYLPVNGGGFHTAGGGGSTDLALVFCAGCCCCCCCRGGTCPSPPGLGPNFERCRGGDRGPTPLLPPSKDERCNMNWTS